MALERGATESKASSNEPESEDEDARTGVMADIAGVNEHVMARENTNREQGQRPGNDRRRTPEKGQS
jgi:hypothetical protein